MPDQGNIVLIPIPFTDLSSSRRRPVIVVSRAEYQKTTADMVVVAMTSNPTVTPYSFIIGPLDIQSGTLNRPGRVRVDRIYTMSQDLIVRTFGKVNQAVLDRIRQLLNDLTQPC